MSFTSGGVPYTDVSGARGTSNVGPVAAIRDVQESMITFKPYQTPILTKLMSEKARKKSTFNQTFEWMFSALLPRTDTVTLAGGASSEDNITVGDSTLYQAGTKFVVDATGEVLIVDSIASSQIDVTKIGSGNITAGTVATVHFLGDSFEQGSSSATAKSVNKERAYNYTEIQKRAVHLTRSQKATAEYGGQDWDRNKLDRMEEFKFNLEMSLLKGIRGSGTGVQNGSFTQYQSGGMFDTTAAFIYNNYQYSGSAPSESWFFNTFLKGVFAKGTSRKRLYAGSNLIQAINDYSKVKTQTKVEATEYGVDIQKIKCPFGMLDLVWHPLMDGDVFANQGVALDMGIDTVKYRYLAGNGENRDLNFEEFDYVKESDARKGQWIGEIGWEIQGNEYHGLITQA